MAQFLQELPFLKRLKRAQIYEKLEEGLLKIVTLDKHDVVDCSSGVYLLLNGKILMLDHTLDDPNVFTTKQVAKPGTWVGQK